MMNPTRNRTGSHCICLRMRDTDMCHVDLFALSAWLLQSVLIAVGDIVDNTVQYLVAVVQATADEHLTNIFAASSNSNRKLL